MPKTSTLAQAIDIHVWLEADSTTPVTQRARRDREIGQQLSPGNDTARILQWWQRLDAVDKPSSGQRVIRMAGRLSVFIMLAGFLVGASVCATALAYDGSYPVNLLGFIGVMVGIPFLLFLLTLLTGSLRGLGFGQISSRISGLNINRWLMGVWDRLGGGDIGARYGQADARGNLAYWQLLIFSQEFAFAFFLGAAGIFIVLVAVSDLAFGWSTTLNLAAHSVHSWFSAMALPWANVWSAAAPDLNLVETSRYYRLETDLGSQDAARLGQWWPFVLMTLLVWGLLPRLLLLAVGRWRVNAAVNRYLREHSEVSALMDRLQTPVVEMGVSGEQAFEVDVKTAPSVAPHSRGFGSDESVLVWNEALSYPFFENEVATHLSLSSWNNEQDIIDALGTLPRDASRLLVVVKSWEPPVLAFNDLLALIRAQVGPNLSIAVAPIGVAGAAADAEDIAVWSRAMGKIGDARIYVVALADEQAHD